MHKKKVPTIFITILFKRYFISKKVYLQFLIKKIVQTRSIKKKKNFLSNFRTFHSNKLRSINTTHAPIFPKNQQSSFHLPFPLVRIKQSMVTEFPQITTPFPVATRVHRFKELSRIRPRRWKLSRHRRFQKTRLNSPRRELDNENFKLVQTEPHLIALESSLDRLYRASLYAIHSDRFSSRDVRMRPKPKARMFTHSY